MSKQGDIYIDYTSKLLTKPNEASEALKALLTVQLCSYS